MAMMNYPFNGVNHIFPLWNESLINHFVGTFFAEAVSQYVLGIASVPFPCTS